MQNIVFTVGHSNHSLEHFQRLLQRHGITAVADVRSMPYSRTNPQFNRDALKDALAAIGIAYVFLGKELGARSNDPACYDAGKVRYERLARTDLFRSGLERIYEGSEKFRVTLMCAEREPLDCHRTILVAKHLSTQGFTIRHVHSDGAIERHEDAIARLVQLLKMPPPDMFQSWDDIIDEAYKRQEERIAYTTPEARVRSSAPSGARVSG